MGRAALVEGWRRWTGGVVGGPSTRGAGAGLYLLATYDDDLARVQLVGGGFSYDAASVVVDRYDTAVLTNPDAVRGGEQDVVSATTLRLDDYGFTPGVVNTYRLRAYAAGGSLLGTVYAAITPVLTTIWLKSPARPFLNRTVTVVGFSDVSAPARGGVLEVAGRRLPVAITEIRGSRQYDLTLRAADAQEAEALELFLSFGDVVLVQVPDGCVVPRSMYAQVSDVTYRQMGKHDSQVRYVSLPLTEVDEPDGGIVGYTVTWGGIVSAFATWADVIAEFATWVDVLQYVSDPDDEIVG